MGSWDRPKYPLPGLAGFGEEYPIDPRTFESQIQDEDKQFESNMADEFAMMDDY